MAPIDPNLVALADGQRGLFTTRQARDVGVVAKALRDHLTSRRISRLARGLYAVTSSAPRSPEARHQSLARGAHLLYDDAVLTGVTAVLAHGLPVWNCDLGRPDLLRPIHRQVGVKPYGRVKYASGDPAVLWAEKRREDDMRAEGKVVVRVTWADLETSGRASAKVRRALARAPRAPLPPQHDPSPEK